MFKKFFDNLERYINILKNIMNINYLFIKLHLYAFEFPTLNSPARKKKIANS